MKRPADGRVGTEMVREDFQVHLITTVPEALGGAVFPNTGFGCNKDGKDEVVVVAREVYENVDIDETAGRSTHYG